MTTKKELEERIEVLEREVEALRNPFIRVGTGYAPAFPYKSSATR